MYIVSVTKGEFYMKRTYRLLAVLLSLALMLAMTACGSKKKTDDGQNPIMNYVGSYVCDRAEITIEAEGSEGCSAIVTWGGSAFENSSWIMSGTFEADSLRFEYHDCIRTDYTYDDNGNLKSEEEVYTGGHGFMFFKDGDPLTLTWQDDQEHVADDMVFEYRGVTPGETTGIANPWKETDSAKAAAEGAGLDGFNVAEMTISLGDVKPDIYRYMDGMVEADQGIAAVDLTIRKGRPDLEMAEGDISGDYNEYKYNWTQNVKGLEVKCFGNREGEATKSIWSVEGIDYAILATGAGGDEDFGLSADDLNSLVNGIQ